MTKQPAQPAWATPETPPDLSDLHDALDRQKRLEAVIAATMPQAYRKSAERTRAGNAWLSAKMALEPFPAPHPPPPATQHALATHIASQLRQHRASLRRLQRRAGIDPDQTERELDKQYNREQHRLANQAEQRAWAFRTHMMELLFDPDFGRNPSPSELAQLIETRHPRPLELRIDPSLLRTRGPNGEHHRHQVDALLQAGLGTSRAVRLVTQDRAGETQELGELRWADTRTPRQHTTVRSVQKDPDDPDATVTHSHRSPEAAAAALVAHGQLVTTRQQQQRRTRKQKGRTP